MQYVKQKEDADEIVNDAFITIWEKRNELDINSSIKAYLYTIVKNKSLNHLKKKNILLETEDSEAFQITSNDSNPIQNLENKEMEKLIYECINLLPPKCKQIFVLSRKEQLSYKEIAKIMDINIKTVENQIGIAIKNIRYQLSKIEKNNHQNKTNNNELYSNLLIIGILDYLY